MKEQRSKHKLLVHMPYVILHILLKNKVLGSYCNNACNLNVNSFLECYYSHEKDSLLWLNNVFYWGSTPEGFDFWDHMFSEVLTEINKDYETNKRRKKANKA